jgi:hypothetical protein
MTIGSWKDRVVLDIPTTQLRKMKKGQQGQVMHNGNWYVLKPKDRDVVVKIGQTKVYLSENQKDMLKKFVRDIKKTVA